MYAIVCHRHGGPEVMQYLEIDEPRPAENEVLIRAEAIGVNYVDLMRRSGKHPAAPKPPFTPGIEVCGRVEAVGSNATRFSGNDRVVGRCVTHGTYAEYVCIEERFVVPCDEGFSPEQGAALFVNGQTAFHALITIGKTRPGENVLVTAAAGGVGTCAVQIAKLIGAKVIAAASTAEKLELARQLGAHEIIDYNNPAWPEDVLAVTDGNGADLFIESVGGEIATGCQQCWAPEGRAVIYGQASGSPAMISGAELLFGNRSVNGMAVGSVIENEQLMRDANAQLNSWMSDGQLRMQIGASYPLRQAADAHRDLKSRRTMGKLVLLP